MKFIQDFALNQVEAGATYVDINCGTQIYDEEATMQQQPKINSIAGEKERHAAAL